MSEPMVLGYDEAGSGPVLLLVHGFPLDASFWEKQLVGLSGIRRVVAVDLRGRRRSPAEPDGWTIDLYADDVGATVEALGVDRVDLAGLSMGGYVVFSFLRRHRDKVRSLLLIDTKAEADSAEAREGREKTAAQVREKGIDALLEGLFPKIFAPGTGDQVKSKIRKMFEDTPVTTAAADALAMRDRADSTADLKGIALPTLVVHGEQDALMGIDAARTMADGIPGAAFVAIPGAGHMAPLEQPDAVNAAIRDFLSRLKV